MKKRSKISKVLSMVLSFSMFLTMVPVTTLAEETTTETDKNTIWIIGDSTVSSFNDAYYYPRYGWGTQVGNYLDGTFNIENLALSGRSSKSYTVEPQYQTLLEGMKQGDYLLIGFGHNDEKLEVARYTNPNKSYKEEGSFANSLYENYIKPANEAGCKVVLCTPIVRRTESKEWSNANLHITESTADFEGGDYRQAIIDLGKELNIPVVDMTGLTKELYDELGPEETINLHSWTSSKPESVDNTHTNIYGAKHNAYLLTNEIKNLKVDGLYEHVIDAEVPTKEKDLESNKDYVELVYSNDLAQSKNWEDIGIWKGTTFGDLGGDPAVDNYTLEQDADGNMHMAVKNNKGKIATSVDGLAMYYYKVPVNSNFNLSAKAKINAYDVNDQVSFGLMARDEMYIDLDTKNLLGDYVAAAPLKLSQEGAVWNSYARKNGVLTQGGTAKNKIKAGDTVDLNITSTSDGYSCTFGNEDTITGGFDFKLTSIDSEYVYVGMFVARNADITFSDIKLTIDGVEITPTSATTTNTIVYKVNSPTMTINGETKEYDLCPIMINNTKSFPLRIVAEALGYEVSYEPLTKSAIVNETETAKITGEYHTAVVEEPIINGHMYVPEEFVKELFDTTLIEVQD